MLTDPSRDVAAETATCTSAPTPPRAGGPARLGALRDPVHNLVPGPGLTTLRDLVTRAPGREGSVVALGPGLPLSY